MWHVTANVMFMAGWCLWHICRKKNNKDKKEQWLSIAITYTYMQTCSSAYPLNYIHPHALIILTNTKIQNIVHKRIYIVITCWEVWACRHSSSIQWGHLKTTKYCPKMVPVLSNMHPLLLLFCFCLYKMLITYIQKGQ